ncbi:MAG: lamin tail domain-containing protein, partial [Acidobacteria bacterium]|nr:lamin tail domain-containing protein [Acidobacteriota bacterium]
MNRGATLQLAARAFDRDDQPVGDATFTWRSLNTSVVTVDAGGLARGAGFGAATVEALTEDGAGGTLTSSATFDVRLPVIFSEILADVPPDDPKTVAVEGDANRDGTRSTGDDEFVELFNPSESPVDLSGVRLSDSTSDRFTFPAGASLAAHAAVVVFGGGAPNASDPAFGGSRVFKASALSLNDTGDTVSLKLKVGGDDITLASQAYGSQGGAPAPGDQSLTRERAAGGVGLGDAFVAHLSAASSAGRPYSPGTLPDGTPFDSAPVTRVEITPNGATLGTGASQTFTARAFVSTPAGDAELANVSFAWDVSDATKAMLSHASGTQTTLAAATQGGFTLRARAGGQESSAAIKINPPPPVLTRVELSPASASVFVGASQQFNARAFDQFEQPFAGATFAFSSSDTNVATIDPVTNDAGGASATATVVAKSEGTTRITATAGDGARAVASNEATLESKRPPPAVARVAVSPAGAVINRGQPQQFGATALDQNGLPVANVSFAWTTTDRQIASVSADGLARGVGLGTVEVIATAQDGRGGTVSGRASLTARAPLAVNEVLADVPPDNANTTAVEGDANRDGVRSSDDDEFVELVNYSDAPLDLSGFVVADSTSNRFTFPANTTLAAGQAAVVFGGANVATFNPSDPAFGGALVFATGSLGLNDGGDIVTIKLPTANGDILIASQAFGSAAQSAPAAPTDQSLTRSPDAGDGNAGGSFVAHANALNAAARVFSPGTRADGTPFGSHALSRIEIAPRSAALGVGGRQTFAARAFANVSGAEVEITNISFIWDAGDAAKVSLAPQTGAGTNATALAAGTTTVRARAGGLEAAAPLTVNPPPPVLARVELSPSSASLFVGDAQQFAARALDQFGQPFAGALVTFASSDARAAEIEASSQDSSAGTATALVRGRDVGAAQITATATVGAATLASDPATIIVAAPTPTPTPTPSPTPAPTPTPSPLIVISEFRTRGAVGANDEFVELYNNSDSGFDVSGWKIN